MFDQLNQYLFLLINAKPGLAGWRLHGAVFAAEWIVFIVPLGLVLMWTKGDTARREAAVRALLAACLAFAFSKLIGMMWFHPRPFMANIGQNFLFHAPDSSFPSDHATGMFSVALALLLGPVRETRRFGGLLLGLALVVAWSRVFLGVHWPLDMVSAMPVSGLAALLAALLANGDRGQALAARMVPLMRAMYGRVLALPIARGWIRP